MKGRKWFGVNALMIGALLLANTVVAEAGNLYPAGWKVNVRSQTFYAKHDLYTFQSQVRDVGGHPVEDARVQLRVRTFGKNKFRLVEMRHTGNGYYQAITRINPSFNDPRRMEAEVVPAGAESTRPTE